MFEIPEFVTLARQINATLTGKTIRSGNLGNRPHKFVWYNRSPEEFAGLIEGKSLGPATTRGKWLFVTAEPDYVLVFGECGGKFLYHPAGRPLPDAYHLALSFEDGSAFSATTQMWGTMELYEQGREGERQYIQGMRPTPLEPEFTYPYFDALIESLLTGEKRSVKGLLTQEQLVPGLGNAIAQDILFRARLHPKHPLNDLDQPQRRILYDSILFTLNEAIEKGGRYDEFDLFNAPGKYIRLMDRHAAGRPCPICGRLVEKLQYLGGACYLCPTCQQ
jgi:formamidopyrimidine-DNA glycosylase